MTVYGREWSALRPGRLTPLLLGKSPHYPLSILDSLQMSISLTSGENRPTIGLLAIP